MSRASRKKEDPVQPQAFLECLRYFLTAQVWKQAQCAFEPHHAFRWQVQPLLFVLLTMTWCAGESVEERFETGKAFYVASYQRKRRPGKTLEGFHKALANVPARALRGVATAVRVRLQQVFAQRLVVDGFVPLGCDGSRLECPRTPELQKRLLAESKKPKKPKASPDSVAAEELGQPETQPPHSKAKALPLPMVFVSAFVHLSTGVLWSWRLGGPHASERSHLLSLLATLPLQALIVTDAGYVGYELMMGLVKSQRWFLIRLSSQAPLYSTERVALKRFREGLFYYWPGEIQRAEQPPIRVRVIRVRAARKIDVWLMTNVLNAEQLSLSTASKFYRWRWRNEGFFRSYKRTLGKVKLMNRTVAQVHREAEGSLLAVQLVLAHGLLALPQRMGDDSNSMVPSARLVLLEIRAEIRNVTGMYLGPRQRRNYLDRLKQAQLKQMRREQSRKKRRKEKVRQLWPGRAEHKPPKPPKFQRMGTDLKKLLEKTLGIPETVDS
jgi:hypothetical protein